MITLEGSLRADPAWRFCLVAARFNSIVVEPLIAGARGALVQHGVPESQISVVRVPGAWELGWACQEVALAKRADAIVALGAVVRGSTPHFDYVAGEAAKSLGALSLSTRLPISFGVLTTETLEQAIDRAGGKLGNKGGDAALVALELLSLKERLAG